MQLAGRLAEAAAVPREAILILLGFFWGFACARGWWLLAVIFGASAIAYGWWHAAPGGEPGPPGARTAEEEKEREDENSGGEVKQPPLRRALSSKIIDALRDGVVQTPTFEPSGNSDGQDEEQTDVGPLAAVRKILSSYEGPDVPPGPPPDLSGIWKVEAVEGDLEGFLGHMGFNAGTRLLLRAMIGAGTLTLSIAQRSDKELSVQVKRIGIRGHFTVGGEPCVTDTELGRLEVIARWEGSVLRIEAVTPSAKGFVRWMYLKDNKLVIVSKTANGCSTHQLFTCECPNHES